MKTCNVCKEPKAKSEFCSRKDAPDGLDYRCKKCEAKRRKNYTERHLEQTREKARNRAAIKRKEDPKYNRDSVRRWREAHPENSRSRTALRRIKFPEMHAAQQAASGLRIKGMHAHHWSYLPSNHRDVIYLTRSQHTQAHLHMKYCQAERCFMELKSGELLDTREKHLQCLTKILSTCPISR